MDRAPTFETPAELFKAYQDQRKAVSAKDSCFKHEWRAGTKGGSPSCELVPKGGAMSTNTVRMPFASLVYAKYTDYDPTAPLVQSRKQGTGSKELYEWSQSPGWALSFKCEFYSFVPPATMSERDRKKAQAMLDFINKWIGRFFEWIDQRDRLMYLYCIGATKDVPPQMRANVEDRGPFAFYWEICTEDEPFDEEAHQNALADAEGDEEALKKLHDERAVVIEKRLKLALKGGHKYTPQGSGAFVRTQDDKSKKYKYHRFTVGARTLWANNGKHWDNTKHPNPAVMKWAAEAVDAKQAATPHHVAYIPVTDTDGKPWGSPKDEALRKTKQGRPEAMSKYADRMTLEEYTKMMEAQSAIGSNSFCSAVIEIGKTSTDNLKTYVSLKALVVSIAREGGGAQVLGLDDAAEGGTIDDEDDEVLSDFGDDAEDEPFGDDDDAYLAAAAAATSEAPGTPPVVAPSVKSEPGSGDDVASEDGPAASVEGEEASPEVPTQVMDSDGTCCVCVCVCLLINMLC